MEQIKDTISIVLSKWQKRQNFLFVEEIENILKQVFSATEQKHLMLASWRQGVLELSVDSSVWLYYFSLHKEKFFLHLKQLIPNLQRLDFRLKNSLSEKKIFARKKIRDKI
ncbi:MAG: hypothetical protein N2606_01985 [Candidatus Omnitrophica bacterium]|nr:hypothetical protein [Candidatus Omnitrophota bacterium]